MSSFTPGPWSIRKESSVSAEFVESGDDQIAMLCDGDDKTRMANARLIAAAPELLDALREAHALLLAPAEDLKDGVLSRIRAAISSAVGPRTAADAINDIRADLAEISKAEGRS